MNKKRKSSKAGAIPLKSPSMLRCFLCNNFKVYVLGYYQTAQHQPNKTLEIISILY